MHDWEGIKKTQRSGAFREATGRCVLDSRTSELGKGFKNSAPAWLAKRSPEDSPSVLIREIRGEI